MLDESSRVLVSGDSVQDGNIFMFGERRDLDRYINSLEHLAVFDGMYDEIYAMHGTFPVKPDLIPKLHECALQIKEGKAEGKATKIFGHDVMLYRFDCAGFLCDL